MLKTWLFRNLLTCVLTFIFSQNRWKREAFFSAFSENDHPECCCISIFLHLTLFRDSLIIKVNDFKSEFSEFLGEINKMRKDEPFEDKQTNHLVWRTQRSSNPTAPARRQSHRLPH
ncbi:predicted protein [Enterococcus gallinarum EG2]|nr:predicted protein [Enterococcus gallinarum EG2]